MPSTLTSVQVTISEISCDQQLLTLRERVLSAGHPGRPAESSLDQLQGARHFGAFLDNKLVGCVSTAPMPFEYEAVSAVQFHSMAVDQSHQINGVGTALLDHVTQHAKNNNVEILWALSRLSAVNFYQRAGMQVLENETQHIYTRLPVRHVFIRLTN